MSQEEDPSNFNGLNLAISGKALIQHSYSDQNGLHNIEIGLPQLDNADRHIMISQNDNAGNPIDLNKYSSIEIVEISQQPAAPRQKGDINIEPALARNQERLSDFYQSYKNEDASIDWSKVATKITLSNTSGTFYDHEDKYTVGFKIELSSQDDKRIEFRDGTTGETIAKLSSSELSATMGTGNLCKVRGNVEDSRHHVFCSPLTQATINLLQYSPPLNSSRVKASVSPDTFCLCQKCGVLYDTSPSTNVCFAGDKHSPASSVTTKLNYKFILPYVPEPSGGWQPYNKDPTGVNHEGHGKICLQCSMVVDHPYPCPAGKVSNNSPNHTFNIKDTINPAYWIGERALINDNTPTIPTVILNWQACSDCGGLYYISGLPTGSATINYACCNGNTQHTWASLYTYKLLVANNISINANTKSQATQLYLNGYTGPGYNGIVQLQGYNSAAESGTWWELGQPDQTSGDYTLKCLGTYWNSDYLYLNGSSTSVQLGASTQTWGIKYVDGLYNIQMAIDNSIYYLIGTLADNQYQTGTVTLGTNMPDKGTWQISIMP